uniref:Uncharacterized protein n=1 Tax=Anguilla anguilla TaxID=7936 RepID=A0A0E9T7K4_ANGAN
MQDAHVLLPDLSPCLQSLPPSSLSSGLFCCVLTVMGGLVPHALLQRICIVLWP